jgi:muconate cycloisomerase
VSAVASVDVLTVELPFRFSFGHALAERSSSTNVVVRVRLDDGTVGYGEGVPREYVTGETVESAVAALCERLVPHVVGAQLAAPDAVPELLAETARSAPRSALTALGVRPIGLAELADRLEALRLPPMR